MSACDKNIPLRRTAVGVWKVSTVLLPLGFYETAVKHRAEAKHRGYHAVISHSDRYAALVDHFMVVNLLRAMERKLRRFPAGGIGTTFARAQRKRR